MITVVGYDFLVKMLEGGIEVIKVNHPYLSQLDTAIGDGDHGTTMLRAMNKMESILHQKRYADMHSLVDDIAWALLGIDGGAAGPLYGSIFLGMAEGLEGKDDLDSAAFASMFEAGLASLQKQTKAKVGDKTMMDALIPAIQTLRSSANEGDAIDLMLEKAYLAAEAGAASTKDMRANFGRARQQGDRTIGTQDPGATSTAMVFKGFHEGITRL